MAMSSLLQSITGVTHAFGDKSQLMPASLAAWQSTLAVKKQVHGTRIHRITQPAEHCGEADGVFTSTPGVLLSVLTADCLPLLFARRDGKCVAALHAGWRGLVEGIIERFAEALPPDAGPALWAAAIGPSAGPCCYEVSESLVEEFITRLPAIPRDIINPAHRRIDLAAIAEYKLKALGFNAVERIDHCTICTRRAALDETPAPSGEGFAYTSFRRNSLKRALDPTYPSISGRNQHAAIMILP